MNTAGLRESFVVRFWFATPPNFIRSVAHEP